MGGFLYTVFIFPIYEILSFIFVIFYKLTANYGLSAIGLSFAVTIMCLPLYIVAERWQEIERNKVRRMAPMVKTIKEVFHGDEQFMILSTYYRQNHYKPIYALRSSFGLLIQIPFFMAAYSFLSNLSDLNGVGFLFIRDLGKPDALFSIAGFGVNILPILMTAINIVAGAIYTKGFPRKEKIQIYAMALVFLVLLYDSPSALVLYWTMNNVLSLVKNIFYKLKRPIKVLYIASCLVVIPLAVYAIAFLPNQNRKLKVLMATVSCLICLLPAEIRVLRLFFSCFLDRMSSDTRKSFVVFILSSIALWFLVGVLVPLNLVASSPRDFAFLEPYSSPLSFVWITCIQAFGFFVIWPVMLFFLFSSRTKAVFAYVFNVLFFVFLLDVFVFRSKLGNVSIWLEFSDLQGFKQSLGMTILDFAVYLAVIIGVAFIFRSSKTRILSYLLSLSLLSMMVMCVFRMSSIQSVYKGLLSEEHETTAMDVRNDESLIEFSTSDRNVIVVMVDRGLSGFVSAVFDDIEGLSSKYDGFVCYTNAVSFAGSTIFGNPGLSGGYEYTPVEMNKRPTESLVDKNNEALKVLPRLFSENGYAVFVSDAAWTDYLWDFVPAIYDDLKGVRAVSLEKLNDHTGKQYGFEGVKASFVLEKNLLRYSLLQVAPPCMRNALYDEAYYRNRLVVPSLTSSLVDYATLDNLPEYTAFSDGSGSFINITSNLVHNPFFLQAPEYVPAEVVTDYGTSPYATSSQYHVMAAAMRLLGEWFDVLKENGVYDNTRIILVSDHGRNLYSDYDGNITLPTGESVQTYQCLLMVKDFDSHGMVRYDDSFMTNADVPYLVTHNLIEDAVNPYTGNAFSMDYKNSGVFVTTSSAWDPADHGNYVFNIKRNEWLFVHDDIHKEENWSVAVPDIY